MKRILITAIGGDIGQSIAQCLRDSCDDLFLFGSDIHDKHVGKLYVNEFRVVPPATTSDYINCISDIVASNNIDVIVPVNETELRVLVNTSGDFHLIHCNKQIVNSGLDKLKMVELLKSLNIEMPWTVDADNEVPINYPCIIKPRFSSGSRSIFIINSKEEANLFSATNQGCVFQELLEPFEKEVTCALYRTRDGRIASLQFERLLVGGLTGWAKVILDDEVDKILHVIANKLSLQGSMNVQLRITEKGPMIFEINPRFSSTVYMRHKLGFTDVVWSLKEFYNKPIKLSSAKLGATIARKHEVVILAAGR